MGNSIITSYAILKENWEQDESKDYLDNFVVLISEAIRHLENDVISLIDLQDKIFQMFGFTIPQNTIHSLLHRVKKFGYIKIHSGTFTRIPEKLEELNFHTLQQNAMRSYEIFERELITFTKENYGLEWKREDVNDYLQNYFQDNQVIVLSCLIDSTTIPAQEIDLEDDSPNYIIGKFIEYLQATHSSLLDFLETIIKGNMLANALFLTEPGSFQRKFNNTIIFIDSPLIIYAMGYAGEPRKKPITELFDLIKQYKGNIKIFRHTYNEVIGILNACASIIRRKDFDKVYGPSIEYFITEGFSETDIVMFIEQLSDNLLKMGIEIVDTPPYDNYGAVIDEEKFSSYIKEKIDYRDSKPLERDLDSITAVFRIRNGQSFLIIEECRGLFLTSNSTLAYCARAYSDFHTTVGTVPLVFTDYELTNLLWLKNPSICPNLPRRRIIADSYATVQPNDRLWSRYLKTIGKFEDEKKITEDEYFLLRYSIQARSELMERTRGNESVFSNGTVEEILKSITMRIRAADLEKLNEIEIERQEALSLYEDEREKRVQLEEEFKQQERLKNTRIKENAIKKARRFRTIITIILSLIFIAIYLLDYGKFPIVLIENDRIRIMVRIVSIVFTVILLVLEILDKFWNIKLNKLFDKLEEKAYNHYLNKIQKEIGL